MASSSWMMMRGVTIIISDTVPRPTPTFRKSRWTKGILFSTGTPAGASPAAARLLKVTAPPKSSLRPAVWGMSSVPWPLARSSTS